MDADKTLRFLFRDARHICIGILALGIVVAAFRTAGFGMFDEVYQRSSTVGVAAILVVLANPLSRIFSNAPRPIKYTLIAIDSIMIAIIIAAVLRFFSVYDAILTGLYTFSTLDIAIAVGGLAVLVELTRRSFGLPLAIIATLSVAYALAGGYLPSFLAHAGYDVESVIRTLWYSFDGVFGLPVTVVLSLIFIFIIFGAVLESTGAGEILLRISRRLTSGLRGGPAHAAVVSSSMFGTFSGSSAANVVGTGVFTIPMIRERGFSRAFAGGVEAAASTGGQFTPPVMGAAAFMIADLTGEPYLKIAAAALVPAMFYYASLFSAVSMEARKRNIQVLPSSQRPTLARSDLWLSSIFLVPILTIILVLMMGRSAAMAGFWATIVAALMGLLNPAFRNNPGRLVMSLVKGGQQCALIMVAVAVVGIVIGVVNQTGLGLRFSLMVLTLANDSLFLALVLTALACLVLGMGLPTLPAYLIIVLVLGEAIKQLGVPALAVHLFVLYYGVMSNITPPVAMAAYAAAPICGAEPMQTAVVAVRLALVGFIIPFMFVFHPSLLLVLEFEWIDFAWAAGALLFSLWLITTALAGIGAGRLGNAARIIRLILGFGVLIPAPLPATVMAIFGIAVVVHERYQITNRAQSKGSSIKREV